MKATELSKQQKAARVNRAFKISGAGATAALLLLSGQANAQAKPPEPKAEKIEVTGSNIKRIDAESASPIQVITADEIKRSGKQTVTEILRALPSAGAGGLNDLTGANSFSSGASTVSLRGLGSAATLVLLNGRRIAPYGLADPNFGQSASVNLDAIPLDAVERIEILKDGASAIYGSEAIAGVVNIILRKDFKGAMLSVRGATNSKGLYNTSTISGSAGWGDLAKDRYNLFINSEVFSRERVSFRDAEDFLNRTEYARSTRYRTGQRAFSSYAPQLNLYPAVVFDPTNLSNAFIYSGSGSRSANACPAGQQRPGETVCRYDVAVARPAVAARKAFRITATSIASCMKAPAMGVSRPAAANPMPMRLNPSPTTIDCFAMSSDRRPMRTASGPRRGSSMRSTTLSPPSGPRARSVKNASTCGTVPAIDRE